MTEEAATCGLCFFQCSSRSSLKRHQKRKHSEVDHKLLPIIAPEGSIPTSTGALASVPENEGAEAAIRNLAESFQNGEIPVIPAQASTSSAGNSAPSSKRHKVSSNAANSASAGAHLIRMENMMENVTCMVSAIAGSAGIPIPPGHSHEQRLPKVEREVEVLKQQIQQLNNVIHEQQKRVLEIEQKYLDLQQHFSVYPNSQAD